MKKPTKSLFQIAAEKYTSISLDLKETRKAFLEETISASDLNQAYAKQQAKVNNSNVQQPQFSDPQAANTRSTPGGNETPAPAQANSNPAVSAQGTPQAAPGVAVPAMDLTRTDLKITKLPDGRLLYEDPKNPNTPPVIQDPNKAQVPGAIKESAIKSAKAHIYTVEDIMSALSVLSTGDVVASENDMSDDLDGGEIVDVKPAGDVLANEEDESEDESGDLTSTDEAGDSPNVDQSGELQASGNTTGSQKSTVGKDSSWTGPKGVESPSPEANTDTESSKEEGEQEDTSAGEEKTEQGKDFTKGAGEVAPSAMNSTTPEIGEGESCGEDEACGEGEVEGETNPSGKDSAFWVPNDDLLGLKDIVGTVAKANGTPNAQETIGKDATGNLVKKPTTPTHSIPNMRQYVRTNGVPGAPSVIPQGGQPVDISDLDSVIGMDSQNDKALNISLNFNF